MLLLLLLIGQTWSIAGPGQSVDVAVVAWMRRAARSGQARALREQAGITGAEMARKLGVSTASFSLWERALRRPTAEHAEAWAQILRDLAS